MAHLKKRLSYANVVASLALFVALGGTSYAAVQLSKDSVRSKHIKNGAVKRGDLRKNAVDSTRVKDGALLAQDFQPGQLVAGAPGATGPQGPKGDKGDTGATGETGTFGTVTVQFTQAPSDLADGGSTPVNAFCPDGQRGVGGGARGDATDSEATEVTSSRPAISAGNTEPPLDGASFTGWRTTVVNKPGGVTTGIRPEVWVVCAAP